MSERDRESRFHQEWLSLAQPIEGLVFSVPALAEAQISTHVSREQALAFKAHLVEPEVSEEGELVDDAGVSLGDLRALLRDFLGYDQAGMLVERADLPASLHFYAEEGRQDIRPSCALARGPFEAESDDPLGGFGEPEPEPPAEEAPPASLRQGSSPYLALVWDLRDDAPELEAPLDLDKPEAHTGPWRYPPTAKLERLLRHSGVPVGLLCNGRELRLVYAPVGESTSHLSFRFAHMAEPAGRPLVAAFELLLGAARQYRAAESYTLEGLLRESRRRQADVTEALAEQVFEAVELLLAGFESAALRQEGAEGEWLRPALEAPHDHLYQGVLSVVLRLVFLLYAEDQGLLPVEHPFYAEHLSVQGLYDGLVEDAGLHPESMHHRFGAYGRLLALFRAVYVGVEHGTLQLPPRHGQLFDPRATPSSKGVCPAAAPRFCTPRRAPRCGRPRWTTARCTRC